MRHGRAFRVIYAAAWCPYAISFFLIFASDPGASAGVALVSMLESIVPAALLGLVVIRACERMPWGGRRRFGFWLRHTGLALAYALLWWGSVLALISLRLALRTHVWTFVRFGPYASQWLLFSGLMIDATICGFAYAHQVTVRLVTEENRAAAAEGLRAEAELRALRAQLSPHFLLNALHSIMELVRRHPADAEAALETLGDMVRRVNALADDDELRTLRDEWAFVDAYLAIERLRLGDRLTVVKDIDAVSLDVEVPAFTLQPLVENAVRHGIAVSNRPTRLMLASRLEGNRLVVAISDDGPGADPDAVARSSGKGLRIVRRRIELFYGAEARMALDGAPGRGFRVKLTLPADESGEGATASFEDRAAPLLA